MSSHLLALTFPWGHWGVTALSPPCTGAVERQTQLPVPFGLLRATSVSPRGSFLLSLLFGEWEAFQALSPSWVWDQELQLVLVELGTALLGSRDHQLYTRVTTTATTTLLGLGTAWSSFSTQENYI